MKRGELTPAHRHIGPRSGSRGERGQLSQPEEESSGSWAGCGTPTACGPALRKPDRVTELPQVGLPCSPKHQSPYSPRVRRRRGRAGAGREPGAPGGNPAPARGASSGGRGGAGTAGAGPACSRRNFARKLRPIALLAPPRFCGPGPRAVPLNLASLHAMPIQSWSAPLIPAAWGQPEEPRTTGFDTLDKPPCHLTSQQRSITC